jgi:hypothetical protein
MPILEDLKEYAERATGLRRPGKAKAPDFVRARKSHAVRFHDDGLVPNHPRWPLVLYRGVVEPGGRHDPAAVIEDLCSTTCRNCSSALRRARLTRHSSLPIGRRWKKVRNCTRPSVPRRMAASRSS